MPEFSLRMSFTGGNRFVRAAQNARARFLPGVRRTMREHGRFVVKAIRHYAFFGPGGLTNRTGNLSKSIQFRVGGFGALPVLTIFSKHPAANLHEFGGTVVPKRAQALAIPLAAGLTSSGEARYRSPLRVLAPQLQQTRRHGRGFLEDQQENLTHVFKRAVRIRPRLGMRRTIRKHTPRLAQKLATKGVQTIFGD